MTIKRSVLINLLGGFAVGTGLLLASLLPRVELPHILLVEADGQWAVIFVLPRLRPAGYDAGRERFTPDPNWET